ncbi:SAM-dependent methyltransferase [Acuticoccus sediminis]|uniref:SAM-dependent methyltransferase n=1 Tax=Acuticoccus sediminis TaxID=2184697 RepID=A0A8B2P439_9HYPH|nr:class I SAM-dependent methyltransferase [Acuticoccus sediminis]RAI03349.1 SAM-dependent methyltransferase [Acuticoccus sediminis]
MTLSVLIADPWDGYALLDSGGGRKLEQYGDVRLVRPEPQAMWHPSEPDLWDTADTRFEGTDEDDGPGRWSDPVGDFTVPIGPARMICRLGSNHHPGLFPEQRPHWDNAVAALRGYEGAEVLNLFGYTGAASLLLAAAGAKVTHIDASKKAIAWARENQEASGLQDAQVRWICEDASKFVAREVRRGRHYQGILLDPPKFGRGPKNEVWNLFDDLPPLMADVSAITAPDARFVILTAYAIRASALAVGRLMEEVMAPHGGSVEAGELALRERTGRLLPTSMFAVWRP